MERKPSTKNTVPARITLFALKEVCSCRKVMKTLVARPVQTTLTTDQSRKKRTNKLKFTKERN